MYVRVRVVFVRVPVFVCWRSGHADGVMLQHRRFPQFKPLSYYANHRFMRHVTCCVFAPIDCVSSLPQMSSRNGTSLFFGGVFSDFASITGPAAGAPTLLHLDALINTPLSSHSAPVSEVGGISEETAACDWWSLGAILFELLTGTVSQKGGGGSLCC